MSLSGSLFLETLVEELKRDKETSRFVSREIQEERASMIPMLRESCMESIYREVSIQPRCVGVCLYELASISIGRVAVVTA